MNAPASAAVIDILLTLDQPELKRALDRLRGTLLVKTSANSDFDTANILASVCQYLFVSSPTDVLARVVHDIRKELLNFILKSLTRNTSNDLEKYRAVFEICARDVVLLQTVFDTCLKTLQDHDQFQNTVADNDDDLDNTLAVRSSAVPVDQVAITTTQSLTLLRIFAWRRNAVSINISPQLYLTLLSLVESSSDAESEASLGTLLAFLSNCPTSNTTSPINCILSESSMCDLVWIRLQETCSSWSKGRTTHCTNGLSIWATVVSCHSHCFPSQSVVHDEQYWKLLRTGLAIGTPQQRKTCLFILKGSLESLQKSLECPSIKVDISTLPTLCNDFARYSTLYETIVLARYLNQVQECLSDLTTLSQDSHVQAPWIIALLVAAVGASTQESVRQELGQWTMSASGIRVLLQAPSTLGDFFESSFLPWATLGIHFNTTTHASREQPICCHGDRLVAFLEQVIAADIQNEDRKAIIKAVLKHTIERGAQMFAFGRVYLLQGLVNGVKAAKYQFAEDEIEDILNIASFTAFNEISRDLMTLQCGTLVSLSYSESRGASLLQTCASLSSTAPDSTHDDARALLHARALSYTRSDSNLSMSGKAGDSKAHTATELYGWLQASRCQCIAGPGLRASLIYMSHVLESNTQVQSEELFVVFQAIWEECEVQEYPKHALMTFPYILFHKNCIALCTDHSELQELLSQAAMELQRSAQHKVYACEPFYSALRAAILASHQAVKLPLLDLIVSFANETPVNKSEFQLEAVVAPLLTAIAPFRTYGFYYGKRLGIGLACFFDMVNKVSKISVRLDDLRLALDSILHPWIHQKRPAPVFVKWKSTTQLQTILILLEGVLPSLEMREVEQYLQSLLEILAAEQLPRYRYLLEWIIARMFILRPLARSTILQSLITVDISSPKHAVSLMKIALMLARLPDSAEDFISGVMTEMVLLATNPKIIIRHEAHWIIPILWTHCEAVNLRKVLENPAVSRINEYIQDSEVYKNPPPGRLLENFDPVQDHTLSNLFQGEYLDIEPSERRTIVREDFLKLWEHDHDTNIPDSFRGDKGLLPLGEPRRSTHQHALAHFDLVERKSTETTDSTVIPLQTKATTWQNLDPTASASEHGGRKAKDVIVVSSLIDNPYNVGGLSRISEIFGVQSLQVANRRVVSNKEFTSVSVSSHLWLPIEELKVADIAEYLVQRKLDGYTVVGIEQTDSSKILGDGDWQFPGRVVLVLGSEREGIPAVLLALMDLCVEVNQVGQTRSMNVQTAAAVVLYEYSRQHP